jgi:hypothetical protein
MMATLLTSSIVVSLAALGLLAVASAAFAVRRGGRRREVSGDHDALAASRFTIPVSVVVPLDGVSEAAGPLAAGQMLASTVAALLDQNYPEFEVIVVAGEREGPALESARATWDLAPHEFFYRHSLASGDVRRIYRSGREARLIVVEKSGSGRADALNCGINLARFRYVAIVDPGVAFGRDALLAAMSAPLGRPAEVAAAVSHVEVRGRASGGLRRFGDASQRLASMRSLLESAAASWLVGRGLAARPAVSVWRRDALVQMNGFSRQAADPELDMMVRLQTGSAGWAARVSGAAPTGDALDGEPAGAPPVVVQTPEIVGWRAPASAAALVQRAAGRRRAALEALGAWRRTAGPLRPALVGTAALWIAVPLLQTWVVVGTAAGAAAGWYAWGDVLLAIAALAFGRALVTSAALLLRGSAADAPGGAALAGLLLLSPFEPLASIPAAAAVRLSALLSRAAGAQS